MPLIVVYISLFWYHKSQMELSNILKGIKYHMLVPFAITNFIIISPMKKIMKKMWTIPKSIIIFILVLIFVPFNWWRYCFQHFLGPFHGKVTTKKHKIWCELITIHTTELKAFKGIKSVVSKGLVIWEGYNVVTNKTRGSITRGFVFHKIFDLENGVNLMEMILIYCYKLEICLVIWMLYKLVCDNLTNVLMIGLIWVYLSTCGPIVI